MPPMTVTEIASAVKGVWWNPSEQVPVVSAVSTDSRRIVPGSLFLPWVGEKFDGHLFIDAALDAGAAGCLCAKLPQNIREDKFYIKVADTRLAGGSRRMPSSRHSAMYSVTFGVLSSTEVKSAAMYSCG